MLISYTGRAMLRARTATCSGNQCQLLLRDPGLVEAHRSLGRAYYNSGQHDRSREAFEQLLEVDPSAHYAHYALGQSLKQLGRRREARTHLRLAVALSPKSPLYRGALDRLGGALPADG